MGGRRDSGVSALGSGMGVFAFGTVGLGCWMGGGWEIPRHLEVVEGGMGGVVLGGLAAGEFELLG